jgi:hypothetical protein
MPASPKASAAAPALAQLQVSQPVAGESVPVQTQRMDASVRGDESSTPTREVEPPLAGEIQSSPPPLNPPESPFDDLGTDTHQFDIQPAGRVLAVDQAVVPPQASAIARQVSVVPGGVVSDSAPGIAQIPVPQSADRAQNLASSGPTFERPLFEAAQLTPQPLAPSVTADNSAAGQSVLQTDSEPGFGGPLPSAADSTLLHSDPAKTAPSAQGMSGLGVKLGANHMRAPLTSDPAPATSTSKQILATPSFNTTALTPLPSASAAVSASPVPDAKGLDAQSDIDQTPVLTIPGQLSARAASNGPSFDAITPAPLASSAAEPDAPTSVQDTNSPRPEVAPNETNDPEGTDMAIGFAASKQDLEASLFDVPQPAPSAPTAPNAAPAAAVENSNRLFDKAGQQFVGNIDAATPQSATPNQARPMAWFSSIQSVMLSSAAPPADSVAQSSQDHTGFAANRAASISTAGEPHHLNVPERNSAKPLPNSSPSGSPPPTPDPSTAPSPAQSGAVAEAHDSTTSGKTLADSPQSSLTPVAGEDGMSAALQDGAMQKTQNVNESSDLAEQNLPISSASFAFARSSESDHKPGVASLSPGATSTSTTSAMPGAPSVPMPAPVANSATGAQAAPSGLAHRSIENFMLNNFPRQDSGSVSVVLTPDANTQLSLHVKMEQGHLQAQAVLDRGDFGTLKADWGSLQSRLADQGVRLAPLASGADQRSSFGSGSSPSHQQQRDVQAENEAPSLNPNQSRARKAAAPAATAHRREWWA